MCTDPHATKERQKVTPVHFTTRTQWATQPFPSSAKIDWISPGMKAIKNDKSMKEEYTQYR